MSGNFKQIYISKLEGVTDLSLHLQDALQQIPQLYHDLPLLQVDAELEGEGVATITVTYGEEDYDYGFGDERDIGRYEPYISGSGTLKVNGKTLYYYDNRGNNGVNPGRFPVTKIGEYYYSACLDYGENFIENSSGERPDYILQGKSSGTFFYIWGGKP